MTELLHRRGVRFQSPWCQRKDAEGKISVREAGDGLSQGRQEFLMLEGGYGRQSFCVWCWREVQGQEAFVRGVGVFWPMLGNRLRGQGGDDGS